MPRLWVEPDPSYFDVVMPPWLEEAYEEIEHRFGAHHISVPSARSSTIVCEYGDREFILKSDSPVFLKKLAEYIYEKNLRSIEEELERIREDRFRRNVLEMDTDDDVY